MDIILITDRDFPLYAAGRLRARGYHYGRANNLLNLVHKLYA
jgi:hypothetical protein